MLSGQDKEKIYKIGTKFHFCPSVKYAVDCTDFHEITTVQWYYRDILYPILLKSVKKYGNYGSLCTALHAPGVSVH
jgi:hypothetical protein